MALDPAVVATLPAQLRDGLIVQRPFWNPHGDPQKLPPPVKRELLWMVQHYPQDDSYLPYTDDAIGFMNSGDPKGEMKKFFEHTYFMCEPPRNLHVSTLDLRLAAWHGSSTIVAHGDLFDVTFIIRRG